MKNASSASPYQRLTRLISIEKSDIWLLVILTIAYGLLGIATPVAVQSLVNIVTMGGVLQPLIVIAIILFALLILSGAIYTMETYIVELIQRRLFVRAAIDIATKAQKVQRTVYDVHNPVELMNRFFDITVVQKSTATLLTIGLTALFQGIIGSIILMFYSLYFAIIVLFIFVCLALIVKLLGKPAEATAIDESKAKYEMMAWLESIARNFNISKFFGAETRVKEKTNDAAVHYINERKKHFNLILKQHASVLVLYAVMGTAMLALGGMLVINGQINLGQFVAAELIIFGVLTSFVRVITKLEYYYDLLAALDKLGILDDLPQESGGEQQSDEHHFQSLLVDQISFQYSANIAPIKDLSFTLQRGQSMAILGDSGAGKSTLIDLLCGLRRTDKGYISYDGVDMRHIDIHHLRDRIGMANKIEVVEGSLLDNLRLGRNNIGIDEINHVLNKLDLLDDISVLPDGIETQVTDYGAPLSTSQLQRLMIARACIGSPEIVMIDRLLDTINQSEFDAVLSLIQTLQPHCMLIITTRFEHVAKQFNQYIDINHPDSKAKVSA